MNKEQYDYLDRVGVGQEPLEQQDYEYYQNLRAVIRAAISIIPFKDVEGKEYLSPEKKKEITEKLAKAIVAGKPARTCNRHFDCDKADAEWVERNGVETRAPSYIHCHDDECEDCFGS